MEASFIISPIVGGVIGYFTNWLAIKMLFRPHKEKRIGKFRIPFTPGLIPKEKERIAFKIGETVGTHLLNEEVLFEVIASKEIDSQLCKVIEEIFENIKEKNKNLEDVLHGIFKDKKEEIVNNINHLIFKWTQEKIQSKELIEHVAEILCNEVQATSFITNIKEFCNEEFRKVKEKDLMIKDVIPDFIIQDIESYMDKNMISFGESILKYLRRSNVEETIKKHFSKLIEAKLGGFVSTFIKTDSIYDGLLLEIEKYLSNEENQKEIKEEIMKEVRYFFHKPFNEVFTLEEEKINTIVETYAEKIITFENVEKLNIFLKAKLKLFLNTMAIQERIKVLIEKEINTMLHASIQDKFNSIPVDVLKMIQQFVVSKFHEMMKKQSKRIVSMIDIPKIVEKRIQSFDVNFTEQIILSVAEKELKAITWLGALLGVLMGSFTPVLNLFIK